MDKEAILELAGKHGATIDIGRYSETPLRVMFSIDEFEAFAAAFAAALSAPPVKQAEPTHVAEVVPYYVPSGKQVALLSAHQDLPIGTKLYTLTEPCDCGDPSAPGVTHVTGAPCFVTEPAASPVPPSEPTAPEPVAEIVECPTMGQQTVREIDGRWRFLPYGTLLYAAPRRRLFKKEDILKMLEIVEKNGMNLS